MYVCMEQTNFDNWKKSDHYFKNNWRVRFMKGSNVVHFCIFTAFQISMANVVVVWFSCHHLLLVTRRFSRK